METLINLDLFVVGNAVAGIAILGFIIFFSNHKSITSKSFLFFSIVTVFWSIANYFQYKVPSADFSFMLVKFVIFLGAWHSYSFFQLAYVFPKEKVVFPKWYKYFVIPLVILISILTITPLVFSHISELSPDGKIIKIENGPGIALFGMVVLGFIIAGLVTLIRKTINASGLERTQFKFVLTGMLVTFLLLMTFNFVLPAFFENPDFIPFGSVFLFPFAALTFYAISKHKLLHMKVISTEILAFVLAIVTLLEVVISGDILILIFRSGIFVLVLMFSILLIKSVRKEVEQREELERLTGELQAANKKLEELSAYKTQLLSLASHQTKSPLSAIKSYASLLIQGLFGEVNDQVKDKLNKIMLASDQLLSLIDTFLNLRKVEEGKMDYKMTKTDLVQLIKGKADELQPLTQSKNLGYEINLPDHPVMVSADAQKLQQILQNFIDNAIKYTPEGKVTINLKEEGGYVIFSVHDSGYGIPADLLPHLFEEYMRDERIKNKVRGTGFGLFIARKIAEAHGGTTWAESEGENKGSTFYLKLKKADSS
jgi:signal transduction histidine kinase